MSKDVDDLIVVAPTMDTEQAAAEALERLFVLAQRRSYQGAGLIVELQARRELLAQSINTDPSRGYAAPPFQDDKRYAPFSSEA